MRTGQSVTLSLGGGWDRPAAKNPAVLKLLSASGGYPKPSTTTFRAVRAGTTEIDATSDMACFHADPPCAAPVQMWSVTVVVSA